MNCIYRISHGCLKGEAKTTFDEISNAKTVKELYDAYRNQAAFMRIFLRSYKLNNK